jgi:PilZ domain
VSRETTDGRTSRGFSEEQIEEQGGSISESKSSLPSARRFPRYAVDARISVQIFRSGETTSLWGRSNELGEDGVGATMTGELEAGEVVSMELALPLAAYPLKLRALVRYRNGLRHGFEFLAINTEQRDVLRRMCEMLATGMK